LSKDNQDNLFGQEELQEDWRKEWDGMPEFQQYQKEAYHKIIIRFDSEEELQNFAKLIGQDINNKTKSIWHPKLKFANHFNKRYLDKDES
tara:strand:- start:2444 stop:2713 length:270 start_codon:yes stop_codon:yes gene_type:complete